MSTPTGDVTAMISAIAAGDRIAGKKLFKLLYDEIHGMAHKAMSKEGPGHVLQTTALVHETYLRLIPDDNLRINDRQHFYRLAARAMRQILISEARRKKTAKRGSGKQPLSLDTRIQADCREDSPEFSLEDLEALDCALKKLETHEHHQWMTDYVDMLFFAGLSFEQVGEMLGVSKSKIKRDWTFTKAWLREEMDR